MNLNSAYRTEVNNILSQHNSAHAVYRADRKRYSESKKAFRIYKEAQTIIQEVAQEVQSNAHSKIAAVVSKCLQAVFDDPYEFKIHFEQKRGKTEARLVFCRDGEEMDPLDATGGGVVDVAAFALRVSSILMSKPRLQRILISDEPFVSVSKEYWGRVQEMLETISTEMGIQIIQVTAHNRDLQMGKLFHIGEEQ